MTRKSKRDQRPGDEEFIEQDEYSIEFRPTMQADAPDNAEEVAEALLDLERKTGQITPVAVIEIARDPKSPLHKHFEWDDSVAAERWRLSQARVLIAAVRVRLSEAPERPPLRAFVHLPAPDGHYESARLAMADEDKREMILRRALLELDSFRRRYAEFTELADVFRQIEALPPLPEPAARARATRPVERGRLRG